MKLHFDFESCGVVDLNSSGVYRYAEDPDTRALLAAWAIDYEPFQCWYILDEPMPMLLRAALMDPDVKVVCHNCNFERIVFCVVGPRQGFVDEPLRQALVKPERWSCTAARAASFGLPRKLEHVCEALGVEHKKDMEGHALMLTMCQPQGLDMDGNYIWRHDPARMQRLGEYCINDGYAERDVDDALPDL